MFATCTLPQSDDIVQNMTKNFLSKEKRSDCLLLVLALAINIDCFIRYNAILTGNTANPDSLPDMVKNIIARNPVGANQDQTDRASATYSWIPVKAIQKIHHQKSITPARIKICSTHD